MKYKLIQMYNLAKATGLAEKTLKLYLDNYLLCKYKVDGKFCLCQDSLDILYSYLCIRGDKNDKCWEASKLLKQNYPSAKRVM